MRSSVALRSVAGYVRQVGKGVLTLVRRAVAFLQFEDGWDAMGYICLSLGLALMLLGTLAAPDLPALYLLADDELTLIAPIRECRGPEHCTLTRCTVQPHPCSGSRQDCKPGAECDLCTCSWNDICQCTI